MRDNSDVLENVWQWIMKNGVIWPTLLFKGRYTKMASLVFAMLIAPLSALVMGFALIIVGIMQALTTEW